MTTDKFGTGDDTSQNDEGSNFGDKSGDDSTGATGDQGITPEELEALRKRDGAAQAHIPELESENKELRDKVGELETNLTNATTMDEVLDRISTAGGSSDGNLDASTVSQIVGKVLDQRQTESKQKSNWTEVKAKLTDIYGDFKTAQTKVEERAMELDIEVDDATLMARNNPKAFLKLFAPIETTNADSSSSVRSGGSGQQTVAVTTNTGDRDAAYYSELRKKNPKEYWSLKTQAQYRRDIHDA